ncbi:Glycoside hydrolase [Macleaya cordata]|uniref:Glycoside hydrolase n=1 Tax=Macleaya cordata TaxID=56857 RepID=A0A200PXJ4_MACCD|nr:Glycoside hydrolase [Macleaya cordata]
MDPMKIFYCRLAFSLLLIISSNIFVAEGGVVGVNYGRLGNNLPSPNEVINLLKSQNIDRIRLFSPDADALNALQGSGIKVVLCVPNEDLQKLGDSSFAKTWIDNNIIPYLNNVQFRYLAVGNEVIPSDLAVHVPPAMENLNAALKAAGIGDILVSTSIHGKALGNSNPPSAGQFSNEADSVMRSIVGFLVANKSPLLVNIYPYFAYTYNPTDIQLDYALFTANRVVVTDGNYQYTNLFDAMVDSTYAALEKVGGGNVDIVITESGWPSAENGDIATIPNARTYINNLISHVSGTSGTPRRPGKSIETYIFALFNENQKSGDPTEQHFGLYYPDMTQVYPVNYFP